jgi:hypothetical protein
MMFVGLAITICRALGEFEGEPSQKTSGDHYPRRNDG